VLPQQLAVCTDLHVFRQALVAVLLNVRLAFLHLHLMRLVKVLGMESQPPFSHSVCHYCKDLINMGTVLCKTQAQSKGGESKQWPVVT
jgi:hypothetical protein